MLLVVLRHGQIKATLFLVVEVETLQRDRSLVQRFGQLVPLGTNVLEQFLHPGYLFVGEIRSEQMRTHLAPDARQTCRATFAHIRRNLQFLNDRIADFGRELKQPRWQISETFHAIFRIRTRRHRTVRVSRFDRLALARIANACPRRNRLFRDAILDTTATLQRTSTETQLGFAYETRVQCAALVFSILSYAAVLDAIQVYPHLFGITWFQFVFEQVVVLHAKLLLHHVRNERFQRDILDDDLHRRSRRRVLRCAGVVKQPHVGM